MTRRALFRAATGLGIALALLSAGCGGGKSESRTQKVGALTAVFLPTPDPPSVGRDSGFSLTLTEGGAPVSGARVHMEFNFIGLNQEGPRIDAAETAPGQYTANEVSTGMGGKWEAAVTISRSNQPDAKFTFPFHVHK